MLTQLSLRPTLCDSLAEAEALLSRVWASVPAALLMSDGFPATELERFVRLLQSSSRHQAMPVIDSVSRWTLNQPTALPDSS